VKFIQYVVAAALATVIGTASAAAHPHVWIKNRSDVVFNDAGLITAIAIEWVFDENYSADATEGLDADGDGFFSAGELQPLVEENLKALKEYDYFVYSKADGKKLSYDDVTEYGQVHSYGTLKMYFTVPLKEPVDPRKAEFSYSVYDPSFFIAIDYPDATAVSVIGTLPTGCAVELQKPSGDEQTEETRQMLSEKSPDWQPETEEDFGSLFAQPVNVICKPKTAAR
jgi:ABC-type uncharacterized transport system substrate-binding protein